MKDPRQQYVYKENRFKKLRFKFFSLLRDIWHEFYYPIKKRWQEYFKTHNTQDEYLWPSTEWASVKRISLELTRALAKLRKNEK